MDKLPVGQLPDISHSSLDDEIMIITEADTSQLRKEKISNILTDIISAQEDNALVKGSDDKLFVTDFGNASNITEGTLPVDVLPESGVTADTYAYPSSVTVNAQGQVTAIEEGTPSGANADRDLSNLTEEGEKHFLNKTQITNCILEIPQNIKYTLEDGTLTIKAGTIVTVPYGTTDQSATYPVGATFINNNFKVVKTYFNNGKFFVQAEVQADIVSPGEEPDGYGRTATINLTSNETDYYLTDRQVSGDNPTVTQDYSGVYNTTTNRVGKNQNNLTIDYTNVRSFPLLQLIRTETERYGNVKQVFNGMGYIGTTVTVQEGTNYLFPNGRNSNNTLQNTTFTAASNITGTMSGSTAGTFVVFVTSESNLIFANNINYFITSTEPTALNDTTSQGVWYNPVLNTLSQCAATSSTPSWSTFEGAICATLTYDGSAITAFEPFYPVQLLDTNLSNATQTTINALADKLIPKYSEAIQLDNAYGVEKTYEAVAYGRVNIKCVSINNIPAYINLNGQKIASSIAITVDYTQSCTADIIVRPGDVVAYMSSGDTVHTNNTEHYAYFYPY